MNKQDVINLICNKLWLWRLWEVATLPGNNGRPGPLYLEYDEQAGYSMVVLIFNKDGSFEFPTKIGFIPPECDHWDFNENEQKIIFYDHDNTPRTWATITLNGFYGATQLNFADGNGVLFNFTDYTVSGSYVTDVKNMAFVPRSKFHGELQRRFSRKAYSTCPVDSKPLMLFLNEIYEYLIDHPEVEDVIISQTETTKINLAKNLKQLLFAKSTEQITLEYCAGQRSIILELITALLTENNNRQLDPNDSRSEDELLQDLLRNRFANRYEVMNLEI
ncbi:hypothetical protein GBO86_03625 [Pediococcus acidilactici]|nr:hypothetical protein GBO86_03625 [Pediococcus acidilactici]UWF33553.1 hypothetical protein NYR25_08195 [Pediococcus acidilactici]